MEMKFNVVYKYAKQSPISYFQEAKNFSDSYKECWEFVNDKIFVDSRDFRFKFTKESYYYDRDMNLTTMCYVVECWDQKNPDKIYNTLCIPLYLDFDDLKVERDEI